jgi:hypothetical protein
VRERVSGAAALDAVAGGLLLLEQLGEALQHDAAQLLGIDDRHGAAVIAGHVVAMPIAVSSTTPWRSISRITSRRMLSR